MLEMEALSKRRSGSFSKGRNEDHGCDLRGNCWGGGDVTLNKTRPSEHFRIWCARIWIHNLKFRPAYYTKNDVHYLFEWSVVSSVKLIKSCMDFLSPCCQPIVFIIFRQNLDSNLILHTRRPSFCVTHGLYIKMEYPFLCFHTKPSWWS